jgi:hypothetical protein
MESLDFMEQALVVSRDCLLEGVEHLQSRLEVEQVLLAPVPSKMFGDLLRGFTATRVAQRRQTSGISIAGHDGADDRHARLAGDITDGVMDLHVHLIQRLLHPLHAASPLLHEVRLLALERSQANDGVAGPERTPEQTVAVQSLQPLAVLNVRLSARNVVHLPSVHEHGLDTA